MGDAVQSNRGQTVGRDLIADKSAGWNLKKLKHKALASK
jgi:hypothetical protein